MKNASQNVMLFSCIATNQKTRLLIDFIKILCYSF